MLNQNWPLICLALLFIIKIITLKNNKNKKREIIKIIFIIYIIFLYHIVTFQSIKYANNLIPFTEILRYKIGSKLFIKNVIGNIILFIPFGILITYLKNITTPSKIISISLSTSLIIEIIQLLIGRVFDIDDIILNTIGAIIGYCIFKLVYKIKAFY